MGMLSNATSGLNAANVNLNVTSQNVSNASVDGYSRQTVQLQTANGTLGGVSVVQVDRIVDEFLNNDIWRTTSDLGYYEAVEGQLGHTEKLLGAESLNLENGVADIRSAFHASMAAPDEDAYRQQVVSASDALVQDLSQLSGALDDQHKRITTELRYTTEQTNSLLSQVAQLNGQISRAQASGKPAAELQDQREQVLKELAEYVEIDTMTDADGTFSVATANGAPLVIGERAASLSLTGSDVNAQFHHQSYPITSSVGGRIGGTLAVKEQQIEPYTETLSDIVKNIADSVNTALSEGYDLNGDPGEPLFTYDATDPLGSIRVNEDIRTDTDKLALIGRVDDGLGGWKPAGGRGDNGNVANIVDSLNNATQGYSALIGEIAIESQQVQGSVVTARELNDDAVAARMSTSGVNLDEEAANLMYYQQMYQANAQVISVADEMFRTLLNAF